MSRRLLPVILTILAALAPGCSPGGLEAPASEPAAPAEPVETPSPDRFAERRARMVREDIAASGVHDPEVLRAMATVPRHRFVPEALAEQAYADHPLPIGLSQTISQPYIVALMTELAGIAPTDRVLEVGTGSGYQAAVLAEIAERVYTIEILEELHLRSGRLLAELGYDNVETRLGDGYRGWPEAAPFDAIVVTAAPPEIPEPLVEQLAPGGRMVIPVGSYYQELLVLERTEDGVRRHRSIPVRFVPMTGEAQEPQP